MPRAKKPKINIRCSETLEALMAKFVPRFGNDDDLRIITTFGKIKKMLGEIRHEVYKDIIREKKLKKFTPKMKEIYDMEQRLTNQLQNRNV